MFVNGTSTLMHANSQRSEWTYTRSVFSLILTGVNLFVEINCNLSETSLVCKTSCELVPLQT